MSSAVNVPHILAPSWGHKAFVCVDPWGEAMIWTVAYYAKSVREAIVKDIHGDKPWSYYYNRGWRVKQCRVVLKAET